MGWRWRFGGSPFHTRPCFVNCGTCPRRVSLARPRRRHLGAQAPVHQTRPGSTSAARGSAQLADKVAKIQALMPAAVPRLTVESFIGYEVHASGKAFVAYQHGLVALKRGGLRRKWRFAEFVPLSKMSVSERGDIRVACKGAALIFNEPQMRRLLLQLPLPSCGSSQALDHEVSRLSILMRFNRFRSRSHSSPPTSEETPRKETLDLDDEEESTMAEWAVTTNCDLEDTDDDDDGDSSSSHSISTSELVSELVRLSSHTDLKRFDNDLVTYSPVRVM